MKIVAKILLETTQEQKEILLKTLEIGNVICNKISQKVWDVKVFNAFNIQKFVYHPLISSTKLSSQFIIRCISKVADAYVLDKKKQRIFKKRGSITYDSRILTFFTKKSLVNIWTINGRMKIPFKNNEYNGKLLEFQKGQTDLIYLNGKFFLHTVCDIQEEDKNIYQDILGVDLGIINLAVDSDGNVFSGSKVEQKRLWYSNRRANLQSVGTKSAKRRLKKLSGKQSRFQRNENHIISKKLVENAKGTKRAISMENLTDISKRTTVTVRHEQRAKFTNWGFYQLKQFVKYKALRVGVEVIYIYPKNTSRTCNKCGHCDTKNRKTQDEFECLSCGHKENADTNAAKNIKIQGFLKTPMVANGAYSTVYYSATNHPTFVDDV